MKILTVVGARPQFIKAAPVSRELKARQRLTEILLHTGQHFDAHMSDIFFQELNISPPDYNLGIHGLTHGAMTGRMMEGIEWVIQKEKPAMVLVYGDTNSTLAGALAAKKCGVRLAHAEAGLRSFNPRQPEEINRILTDRISDLLFIPSKTAHENLLKEGFEHYPAQIIFTGDVMLDTFLHGLNNKRFSRPTALPEHISEFVLCTVHREENTEDRNVLLSIVEALNSIHELVPVIWPVHPRTEKVLTEMDITFKGVLTPAMGYNEMMWTVQHASLVLTDSGGLQKEAYYSGRYCITLRSETEWKELVQEGYNYLAGTQSDKILEGFRMFFRKTDHFKPSLYGTGQAAAIMAESLFTYLSEKN